MFMVALPLWFKRGGPPSIYSIIQKNCKRVIIHFKKQSPTGGGEFRREAF